MPWNARYPVNSRRNAQIISGRLRRGHRRSEASDFGRPTLQSAGLIRVAQDNRLPRAIAKDPISLDAVTADDCRSGGFGKGLAIRRWGPTWVITPRQGSNQKSRQRLELFAAFDDVLC